MPGVVVVSEYWSGRVGAKLVSSDSVRKNRPASGLPPAGDDPAWQAGPVYGERSPLVTDDQAGRQGTL